VPDQEAELREELRAALDDLDEIDELDSVWLADVLAYVRTGSSNFIEEISPLDRMYTHDPIVPYFPAGRAALRQVRLAMLAAGESGFESILDFGCGFGRVLRMLKAGFPDARLTASDVRKDAVDFCADVLGATPVYSSHDPTEVDLGGPFDLIWCGSVFTHFDADRWAAFLPYLESHLAPRGLLVFTTLGRVGAERFRNPAATPGHPEQAVERMLNDYDQHGFGFLPAPRLPPQGNALSTLAWVFAEVQRRTTLRLVGFHEAGWGQQDVVACARGPFD
jgi:SAM-dependent methyltransferase